jgi:RPAP1-like, N-terminal
LSSALRYAEGIVVFFFDTAVSEFYFTGDVVERWWPEASGSHESKPKSSCSLAADQMDIDEGDLSTIDSKIKLNLEEIRKENDRKLSEMSEKEILKQQQDLLETLG